MEERLLKLDKYYEAVTSKKQQRSELRVNDRSCALSVKMSTQMNSLNQRLEDRPKHIRLNKRVRTSVAESRECKSIGLKKRPVAMEKDGNYIEDKGGGSDLFAEVEGWDKNVKRKRSVGTMLTRPSFDNVGVPKKATRNKIVDKHDGHDSQQHDSRIFRSNNVDDRYTTFPSPVTKSKAVTMVAARSHDGVNNRKPPKAPWVGQRPQKMPRTRRENLVSPVSNQDEKPLSFKSCPPMASSQTNDSHVFRKSSNGPYKLIVRFDNVHQSSPPIGGGQSQLKGKEIGNNEVGKKNRPLIDKESNGVWKQGRALTNCNKNGSKPTRGLKRKNLSNNTPVRDGSSPDCTGVSDDDQDELLAAANHARVATQVACSSPFWKKMEPLFATVSSEDKTLLSQKVDILQTSNESPPLYQRVLSALITEEDIIDDGIQESDSRITHFQTTSSSYPRKRARLENNVSQYEHMSLEDKLLLELQTLGILTDNTLPGLDDKDDETIQHEVDKLKTSLHQHEVKKKGYLQTINEGVEGDSGDLETRAMDRLVEIADKKITGIRRSSRLGIDKGPNQSALSFGKRTLARCHKFEKSGTSVFNEPPLKDILSASSENEPEGVASTKYIVSRNSHLLSDENGRTPDRGKNKSLLLDDVGIAAAISGGVRGKRSKRATTRKQKLKPSKNTDVPSTSSGGRCVNNPSGSIHPVQPSVNNTRNVPVLPLDDDLDKIEELGGGNDLDSFLNFDEKDPEVDLDFAGGLDIPMDNLEELGMF